MNNKHDSELPTVVADVAKANETPAPQLGLLLETTFPSGDFGAQAGAELVPSPSPSRTEDRYVRAVLHEQGGMGRIWVARDTALERDIALKELHPEFSQN